MKPVTLFYSYSHKDTVYKEELETHLRILERQGLLIAWSDRQIEPGDNFKEIIKERLETSDIILLLISADYISSEFCWGVELLRAMERHHARSAKVLPVIVRACQWKHAPFGELMALPENGRPVSEWESSDKAWSSVAQVLWQVCEAKALHLRNSSSGEDRHESPELSSFQGDLGPLARARTLRFMRNSMIYHGRYLSRVVGKPVFFLAMHPSRWEPVYCGLPNSPSEVSAQQIRQKSEALRKGVPSELASGSIFNQVARGFLTEIQHSTHEIINGAIAILLSDAGLHMGYESDPEGTAFFLQLGTRRTRGWFQDALDFWGTLRLNIDAFDAQRKYRGEEEFCKILYHPSCPRLALALLVRDYMRRPCLLQDRFLILLAEFLLFRAQCTLAGHVDISIDVEPSKLNHVFLPLRLNGQWRTTACWLSHDEEGSIDGEDIIDEISPEIREDMNARCSQTYLEGFSTTLMAELVAASHYAEKGAIALYRALSVLWWGNEFWFYRGCKGIYYIHTRLYDGKHCPGNLRDLPPPPPPQRKFFSVSPADNGYSTLVMDLRVIPGGKEVAAALSVDVVVILARLFELDDEEQEGEISEQLAERILLAVSPVK
jgi:hypothetical protein